MRRGWGGARPGGGRPAKERSVNVRIGESARDRAADLAKQRGVSMRVYLDHLILGQPSAAGEHDGE